jgi:urea transporter
MPSLTETLVGLGFVLIIAGLLLKRARARQVALIGAAISLIVACVLNPDIIVTFADRVSTILDGQPPDY